MTGTAPRRPARAAAWLLALLALSACASPERAPPPAPAPDLDAGRAEQLDFLRRLTERRAAGDGQTPLNPAERGELLNRLEHLLPSWREQQRRGNAAPVERLLRLDVVLHFDTVADAFQNGSHERRIVTAWALGFSRVPPNDLGIESPHPRAVSLLVQGMETADDEVMRNIVLGLWKLADADTPLGTVLELAEQHHDPDVRANATLALGTILTRGSAPRAEATVLACLRDREGKVRLHAANVARRFPLGPWTRAIERLLPSETMALVRAGMAAALGSARSRSSAPVLIDLLGSGIKLEARSARMALRSIFGTDLGSDPSAWRQRLP